MNPLHLTRRDFLCVRRRAAAGAGVLFRLHIRPGQLLRLHDLLPRLCVSGAGGEDGA